jgi:hypothetical protein
MSQMLHGLPARHDKPGSGTLARLQGIFGLAKPARQYSPIVSYQAYIDKRKAQRQRSEVALPRQQRLILSFEFCLTIAAHKQLPKAGHSIGFARPRAGNILILYGDGRAGLAKSMRAALREAGFVASIAKPAAEFVRRERLAPFGHREHAAGQVSQHGRGARQGTA